MSVNKLREATEKKGCQVIVWAVMVLCLAGLTFTGFSCFLNPNQTGSNPALEQVVVTVNDRPIKLGVLQQHMGDLRGRFGGYVEPEQEFTVAAVSLADLVQVQITASLAAQRGVKMDDAQALAMASTQFDAGVRQLRSQAVADKKIAANATDQQFQQYFEKEQGITVNDLKKRSMDDLKKRLEDPLQRESTLDDFIKQALVESYYSSATVTDEEVKRSYDNFSYRTITFDKQELGDAERKAAAQAALAEIRAGADFDAVAKKSMKEVPKDPTKLSRTLLEGLPYLTPLATMKVGDVSEVVSEPGSIYRIYKLTEYKSELPSDYEATKSIVNDSYRRGKAQRVYSEAVGTATKSAKFEWKSKGLAAIWKVYETLSDTTLSEEQHVQRLLDVVDKTEVTLDDPAGPQMAKFARLGALMQLDTMVTPEQKQVLLQKKVEVFSDILVDTESVGLRLKLVDVYLALKDAKSAVEMLKMAANNNTGQDLANQQYFSEINLKLNELETNKQIAEADANEIRTVLLEWSKRHAEDSQAQNEQRSDIDEFTINPATGKTYGEEAREKAAKGGTTSGATPPTTTTTTGGSSTTGQGN